MRTHSMAFAAGAICALLGGSPIAWAGVSAQEAAQLKTTLTPFGAERAGNSEGTIPAWEGGLTTPTPGFTNGGKRPDPFADEKPLFSITAKNMDQYADKLTESTKALLKKYPASFRVDVYPTHRTAAAPQWVCDNTFQNATRAKLVGNSPEGAFGGIPFPIPKSGLEVMWNHELRWRGTPAHEEFTNWMVTKDGNRVLMTDAQNELNMPYYFQDASPAKWDGDYWLVRSTNVGPPIRAGEIITGRQNTAAEKNTTWVYLTGQRRVRRLPNSCCDTPTPFSGGLASFDEVSLFGGMSMSAARFDWNLVGKKEMYIPYNSNKTMVPPKPTDVLGDHFLNPDHVRWELHRVWIVEATLKPGQRHTSPRSLYYVDEDSWSATLADRWDANGQLWRGLIVLPIAMPDVPAVTTVGWGYYDLLGGSYFIAEIMAGKAEQYKIVPPWPNRIFTGQGIAAEGVR